AFGLAGAVVGVYWERLEFAGSHLATMMFRASGFNSATHVGGAYLEATLAMLVPFGLAAAAIVDRNGLKAWWYGIVVASAGAVLMTLSRAAVAAWLIGVVAFAVLARLKSTTPASNVGALRSWWRWAFAAACLIVLPFVAGQSELLWGRLGTSRTDLEVRVGHWRDALGLMRERPGSALFGMGLGSFPRDFYLANAERMQLPAYRLSTDASGGLPYLELLGGQGMYVDQRVSAGSARTSRLTGEVRSSAPGAAIAASLCEKSMLNSARCTFARIRATTNWSRFDVDLPSPRGATSGFVPAMPLAFSLANPQFGTRVEVTELSLRDGRRELLRNGSFRHGLDHWFMTSDDHLAWHTKNTALEIFFEQGALGILAWLALAISAVAIVLEAGRRPAATAAFAGSVVAFLAVGTFDSILDSPRIVVLIALIVVTGWLAVRATHLPRRSESATEGPS
ncbi:MAG TPA: hypothetical protein VFU90_04755, partial [Candidatus Tumulicola sp.]|nr:hypothetical protein [Candidatus Tumulicola sp.]